LIGATPTLPAAPEPLRPAWIGLARRSPWIKEIAMDWNRVQGSWKQIRGQVKEKWGRLTDDDLDVIDGRRDQLEGKIQERYGLARDQARRQVEDWFLAS
jgi:uncharacterized protein YjbJ (UPF0337 family)